MTFALIATAAMCLAFALRRWQETEMAAARWRLYALRDELRWAAIESGESFRPRIMRLLDESLTRFCALCQQQCVSLWIFGSAWALMPDDDGARERARDFIAELKRPEHAALDAIYDQAVFQIMRVLFWRHLFLTLILVPTIVGGVFLFAFFKHVARVTLTTPFDRVSRGQRVLAR